MHVLWHIQIVKQTQVPMQTPGTRQCVLALLAEGLVQTASVAVAPQMAGVAAKSDVLVPVTGL